MCSTNAIEMFVFFGTNRIPKSGYQDTIEMTAKP